jgi:hypothetical protein
MTQLLDRSLDTQSFAREGRRKSHATAQGLKSLGKIEPQDGKNFQGSCAAGNFLLARVWIKLNRGRPDHDREPMK